jgi:hypothetical protein
MFTNIVYTGATTGTKLWHKSKGSTMEAIGEDVELDSKAVKKMDKKQSGSKLRWALLSFSLCTF